jgi:hypothetical protein
MQTDLLPCHIESIRFFPPSAGLSGGRPAWAAVIAFDVDEDHLAFNSMPVVIVDDESGETRVIESL